MKQTAVLVLLLLLLRVSMAQTGSVTGKVADSATGKILPLATVTVFKAKDTSIITYRLSNPEGEFKIPGLPLNIPLRVMITFSGYDAFRKDFTLTTAGSTSETGTVKLAPTSKLLDEVIVVAERPPVVIKNDTVEFNATAFKTLPNALVEDLLKKLPGVQVDADGNISVNGKVVNRILVDGKTFFGNDPKMATRNLPANIIDKVQVTDDKEELLRNGDDNLNNVGKVVNITLKKGVKKGWFGKTYAGGGSDQRFEAGAIANIFRDTLQLSLLGYMNNLNRPGFGYSDLMQAGGIERSSSNLGGRSTSTWASSSGGSGISINGVNFGGAQNYGGIATSKGLGFNLNHAPSAKQSLFLQYFYGNINIDRRNESETRQFNSDTIVRNNTILTGGVITNAHNIGIGGKLKPDSVTTILLSANYTIGLQDEKRWSDILANNNLLGPLSTGNIRQNNDGNTYYYRHSFSYTRLSKTKKGRRYTISHNLDINNRFNDYSTVSATHFIYPVPYDSLLNQLRKETIPRTDANLTFNYSEPFSKVTTLRMGGRYEYSKLNNRITTLLPNTSTKEYDVINPEMSSDFYRESHRFYAYAGLEFKIKNLLITPVVRTLFQNVNNVLASSGTTIQQKQSNLLSGLSVAYKQFNLNYNKDVALPGYNYLIPVSDNTNPYFIVKGNPNLLPVIRHNISLNYYANDPKRNLNVGMSGGAGFSRNDVIQGITVDSKGIQTSVPVNADGGRNFWVNYNVNRQYKNNQRFILTWNVGAYYSYNRSRLLYNGVNSFQSTFFVNQWTSLNLNFNDKVEFNNNYSIGYNFTSYTSNAFKKLEVVSHNLGSEMIVRYPKHIIWESNLYYSYTGNMLPGIPKDMLRWNVGVNLTTLKDDKGVIRLSVNDVLNRNANIGMSASRNLVSSNRTNALGRYVMLTFTYNIRSIGGTKKKIGGDRLFLF